jgi:hypothetical protein
MPLWATGVANAHKESMEKYFVCFNNNSVNLVNVRYKKVTEPTLTSLNERAHPHWVASKALLHGSFGRPLSRGPE